MRKIFLPAFLLFFLSLSGEVRALEAEVEDLSDRAYLERAVTLLSEAKKSIAISLYQFDIDPARPGHPGTRLFQALLKARERNVSVFIILNRNYEFLKGGENSIFTRNDDTYGLLKDAGFKEVYFADPGRRVHDKLAVIDREWVIEGSHNWSASALRLNRESSTLIHSTIYALLKEERIKSLKRADPGEEVPEQKLILENAFLKDSRYLQSFVGASDFRAMALYLWLRYEAKRLAEDSLALDLEKMAGWLRLPADWKRSEARRQLIKVLKRKLQARYRLIEVEIPFGRKAKIKFLPIQSEEKGFLSLPVTFFEYGTIQSLSHAGLVVYLTGRYLSETSPIRPWWQIPQNAWAALFGISSFVIKEGSQELRRLNLLEVIYFGFEQKPFFENRPPNQYRLNRLVSEAEKAERWQKIRKETGEDTYRLARRYARELNDPQDPELTERLIELLERYPPAWLARAMNRVAPLQADNPRKTVYYVAGILAGWALEGVHIT